MATSSPVSPGPSFRFLAFDTSGPTARVALVDGEGRIVFATEQVSDRHSGTLLPMCHDLISRAGLTVADLAHSEPPGLGWSS